jgi:hypothetical protein
MCLIFKHLTFTPHFCTAVCTTGLRDAVPDPLQIIVKSTWYQCVYRILLQYHLQIPRQAVTAQ